MTDLGKNQMLILGQDDMGQQVIIIKAGQMEREQSRVTTVYDIFRLFETCKTSEQTKIAWKKLYTTHFVLIEPYYYQDQNLVRIYMFGSSFIFFKYVHNFSSNWQA